ncbi:MAG: GHMP kinase [Candidatus Coatesbacteria bacterium]|nr:GHMP kinase [Candidatus Coatesbacteria bacterium]
MDTNELELFIPGRICLFGEHSDWAGGYASTDTSVLPGYTLVIGTEQGIFAKVSGCKDKLLVSSCKTGDKLDIPFNLESLDKVTHGNSFFRYVAGTSYEVLRKSKVDGICIDNHDMNLPLKKGLSSSAAICILTVRAFNKLYNLGLPIEEEMELAYIGERRSGSMCGRMDQACAFGNRPILMEFHGDKVRIEQLSVKKTINIMIVDLKARKDTVKILSSLNLCFNDKESETGRNVRNYLGHENRRIVLEAREALQEGDSAELGRLMTFAQERFDEAMMPACKEELSAPKLHSILSSEAIQPYIYGGKGVGSQGDGTAQLVLKDSDSMNIVKNLLEPFDVNCYSLKILPKKAIPVSRIIAND